VFDSSANGANLVSSACFCVLSNCQVLPPARHWKFAIISAANVGLKVRVILEEWHAMQRLVQYIYGNVNRFQLWEGNMLQLTSPRGLPFTTTQGTNWFGGCSANVSAAFWSSSCKLNWSLVRLLDSIKCNLRTHQLAHLSAGSWVIAVYDRLRGQSSFVKARLPRSPFLSQG
jgi:hypothetical protein